ncbi:MAG: signal peptidase II [Acidimicrobiia bacterium]
MSEEAARLTSGGRSSHALVLTLVVAATTLGIDQLTKAWAVDALDDRDIDLFWTLRFNLTHNSGMAFSRGEGMGPIISVLAMAVVVWLVLSMRSHGSRLSAVAAGMVVGGAVGNVADRLFRSSDGFLHGSVVDFIDVQWWPIFNVADIGVVVGGIALAASSLFQTAHHPNEKTSSDEHTPMTGAQQ